MLYSELCKLLKMLLIIQKIITKDMDNNKDNITNNNTYLILFIVFLIGFIVFLIGFIYYYRRSNFDRKKLKDFIYPKVKTSIY